MREFGINAQANQFAFASLVDLPLLPLDTSKAAPDLTQLSRSRNTEGVSQ